MTTVGLLVKSATIFTQNGDKLFAEADGHASRGSGFWVADTDIDERQAHILDITRQIIVRKHHRRKHQHIFHDGFIGIIFRDDAKSGTHRAPSVARFIVKDFNSKRTHDMSPYVRQNIACKLTACIAMPLSPDVIEVQNP
jgi:hypothetical protein